MMRAVLLLCCLVCVPLLASAQCPGVTTPLVPFATESLTVGATATALTNSIYKPSGVTPTLATLSVEDGAIRYMVVGSPTATDGHPVTAGATFTICGIDSITAFKAIRVGTDAHVRVTYYKPR
jgi:hypothetical protein